MTMQHLTRITLVAGVFALFAPAGIAFAQITVPVLQWNSDNSDCINTSNGCSSEIQSEATFIAGLMHNGTTLVPKVVTLQEVYNTNSNGNISTWVTDLNNATGQTWRVAAFAHHLSLDCTTQDDEGAAILTTYTVQSSTTTYLSNSSDSYKCARGAAEAQLLVDSSTNTSVRVFTTHAAVGQNTQNSVGSYRDWAAGFSRPQILSCDCNDDANATDPTMSSKYLDAWLAAGSGSGLTINPQATLLYRFDYWFNDAYDSFQPVWATTPSSTLSDHLPVFVEYTTNILSKAGFEEYVPPSLDTIWNADSSRQCPGCAQSDSTEPNAGAHDAICTTTASSGDCGIYQDVSAPATSSNYTVRFFAKASLTGGSVGVNVDGVTVWSSTVSVNTGTYGAPYVSSPTFSATSGHTIRVWLYSPGGSGWVAMDDVFLSSAQ